MPAVNSKPIITRAAGLPTRSLSTAAIVSLAVVVYSYIQHRRTAEKTRASMARANALSTLSMRNLRSGAYGLLNPNSTVEYNEQEERFDRDAVFFPVDGSSSTKHSKASSGGTGKLDATFFRQLRALRRIIIPSLGSKEAAIIAMHAVFLVLRTWLSVVVAELDGKIVKHLVRGKGKRFLAGLFSWFAIAIPATYTNSMIRFLESKLALAFRTRLTHYVHDLYLNDRLTYYKLLSLDGRISHPDQLITTDIARFCNKLASFLSNLGKPTLDTIIFNYQLIRGVGLQGTIGMFAMYMATASLLRAWTPPFGKMAAEQARLEGDLRASHARIITSAEEIAFYRGSERESEQLQWSLSKLLDHARKVAKRKISHVVVEDMIIKYTWSAFGYLVCALPFFLRPELLGSSSGSGSGSGDGSGYRTQRFVTNKRILVNLSDAGGRVMYSIKEVMELTGYTSRVYGLVSTLHALRRDSYEGPASGEHPEFSLSNVQGSTYEDIDGVRFTRVPVVVPGADPNIGGELLVRPLTWEVKRGQHWMIAGPNGVGKTSVLRVLSGLWPAFSGMVERPAPENICYIPQRAYLPLGSLRDQIVYPHTREQMQVVGRTDEELMEVLEAVHLAYLPAREGGFNARKEWKDVLSGGEKQRINLARLFYHLPRFAVLDECTSAVSADVEGLMYEHAKRLGITLITISHRPALYKYHSFLLRLGVADSTPTDVSSIVSSAAITTEDEGEEANSSSNNDHPETPTSVTDSWVSDVGVATSSSSDNSSANSETNGSEITASTGVLWDVVQLPSATESSSPASSGDVSPNPITSPVTATLSSAQLAREDTLYATRQEISQLRQALEAKRAQEDSMKARLQQVQKELAQVVV